MKFAIAICITFLSITAALASEPLKANEGMYFEKLELFGLGTSFYLVDTVAQQCFFTRRDSGLVTVPCADLVKRPEWKPIITWVK